MKRETIKLLCPPSLRPVMSRLGDGLTSASRSGVEIDWQLMPPMLRLIESGAPFDVAILTPALIDAAIAKGRIRADTRTVFGRTGAGVAVRAGSPLPDVSTVAAFTRTLRAAASIGYTADGAAGHAFLAMLERLGLHDELTPRLRALPGGGAVTPVANGEVVMSVTTIPGILEVPDATLAGPLPEELQTWVTYCAGMSASSEHIEAAAALVAFLRSANASTAMKACGVEPVVA